MSYGNGYGDGGRDPYAQPSPGYPQSPPYDNGGAMGRDSYGGQNVEMASLAQNGSQPGQQVDPNYILNACRDIDREIDDAAQYTAQLDKLTGRLQNELDQSYITRELNEIASNSALQFKAIIEEISKLKRMPESGTPMNQGQIGRVSRKLKQTMDTYKSREMAFEHAVRDQMRREYRIVNPDATESEVNAAVPNAEPQQMFQQALMTSNRQGQANSTLNAVRQRNEAIKKIEKDIIEIATLFQQMDELVVQQEAAVVNIEMKGEEVVENLDKGVQQMDTAIVSARSRNRKKWYCLGIVVIIVAIIAIVLAVHFTSSSKSNNDTKPAKRSIPTIGSARVVPGTAFTTSDRLVVPGASFLESKIVVPGQKWSEDKAVVPGVEFTRVVRKWKKFVA
ncbi:6d87f114-5764-4688-b8c4-cd5459049777 [Sclerotinia trifoliorum]|uniref:6d87f114-5764-4688-b8c4-cd5459049777 n=1 Tax=Sclerotinia trifoliorum TaxID=28548 RepID=A0A8H2W069_9HELO|nr:6d87f114-5764-4688-b8c4-cd5459049777 [Sclerotinia trifoliorum]